MLQSDRHIQISADAEEQEGSDCWPIVVSLRRAYFETCALPNKFAPDRPKEALLGALQSGSVRAVGPHLVSTPHRSTRAFYINRQFSEEYIAPVEWAKCKAFNPRENSMNSDDGTPRSGIGVYSHDLCHWLTTHGHSHGMFISSFSNGELGDREMTERLRFEETYLLSDDRFRREKRGAPSDYDWAGAVARAIFYRLHERKHGDPACSNAQWAMRLQDQLGTRDGGPAAAGAVRYASAILKALEFWRESGEDFSRI